MNNVKDFGAVGDGKTLDTAAMCKSGRIRQQLQMRSDFMGIPKEQFLFEKSND